jgi:glycosyltransferase involved in cell wall biosynthesis
MSMGKAVVVTRSRGQGDTVVDQRKTTRAGAHLPTIGNLGQFFGENEFEETAGQTGFYVSPGDPAELRRAIDYLLANPQRAAEMGQAGRRMVEALMKVEQFADRIKRVIEEEVGYPLTPAGHLIQPEAEKGQAECSLSGLPL